MPLCCSLASHKLRAKRRREPNRKRRRANKTTESLRFNVGRPVECCDDEPPATQVWKRSRQNVLKCKSSLPKRLVNIPLLYFVINLLSATSTKRCRSLGSLSLLPLPFTIASLMLGRSAHFLWTDLAYRWIYARATILTLFFRLVNAFNVCLPFMQSSRLTSRKLVSIKCTHTKSEQMQLNFVQFSQKQCRFLHRRSRNRRSKIVWWKFKGSNQIKWQKSMIR